MNIILWLVTVIGAVGVVSFLRLRLLNACVIVGLVLLLATTFGYVGFFTWLVFLGIAIPLNMESVRKQYMTQPMLDMYRKIMPEMSTTEKEAIDAGTVWWDGEIFSGNPDWRKLHAIPKAVLSAEEQAFLDGPVEEACRMVDDWEVHHTRADLSPETWQFLKDNKFFAMIIKKKYGGLEFSAYAQSRVLQKLSGCNAVLATTVGVPNSLGPGELLQHYGTTEQQDHYLPRLATGEEIPCFALTGREAGSDAGAIPDTGVVCKGTWQGEEIIGMKLTFDKRYITLAPVATVIGLAFKMTDPEGLLGGESDLGITCALIPRDTKGLEIGNRHFPLNIPFQNGPLKGTDIFVPLDYIIGGAEMAGQGWRMLVECLSVGRCITLPSTAAGATKSIALATGAYARIRRQFKIPVGKMEGIEEMLGRIGSNAYMMDAVTSLSTKGVDLGEKPSVISAICKYHLTENIRSVVNDSMDVHGGKGIMLGPNNYLGRAYQGTPISITVEGANILTRNMMIYGQGAIRCHPFVLKEMYAAGKEDESEALAEFDHAVFGHIGFAMSNFFRSWWYSLTGAITADAPFDDETSKYYKAMKRYSANMALLSDVAMAVLGGELKRKERLSARLGDILSYLYLASATLKKFDDQGRQKEDLVLLHRAMQDSLYSLETAIDELLHNFPNKVLGYFLRAIIMPFGKSFTKPGDELDHKIATLLQTPGEARNRLAEGQYLGRDEGNPMGKLEQILDDILAAEPLYDKVCKAADERYPFTQLNEVGKKGLELGVLTEEESELMARAEQGRLDTINVDDFAPEELMADKTLLKPKRKPRSKAS
ncbi:acyl-CoA dehydrogenase FadE [Aliiglaciecola sp. 2_MG-2023]|uniref:acyl-CoA dehydrogenase FadE n=1 Tax=Alteromonadaceae TaxID=72275 RepID=UPI0026E346D8|nr:MULTISPECIES: acyl-CoA dehydrogenase FadE [unclassified Aliiglaciecola]MDO6712086.1 acyl-CoA dehydrogenase FadE [Aliiglaciecola sp. 2_MG-2023]MDO6753166.1 acyl-CoA dehydrogenase FadE [Aliiglaciecola sp. 1_MG-2023]